MRAVVTAASGNDEAFDRGLANRAGLAFATIHAMPKLKKTFFPGGIDVVGNAGSAEANCLLQNPLQCRVQTAEFVAREGRRTAPRTNPGTEQRLVGINISHAAEQFLV